MKAVLLFALLCAAAFTSGLADDQECNPDGNGMPTCDVLGVFRNNWDPVHYWECKEVGAEPVLEQCVTMTLFDGTQKKCVPIDQWQWVPPCSEAA